MSKKYIIASLLSDTVLVMLINAIGYSSYNIFATNFLSEVLKFASCYFLSVGSKFFCFSFTQQQWTTTQLFTLSTLYAINNNLFLYALGRFQPELFLITVSAFRIVLEFTYMKIGSRTATIGKRDVVATLLSLCGLVMVTIPALLEASFVTYFRDFQHNNLVMLWFISFVYSSISLVSAVYKDRTFGFVDNNHAELWIFAVGGLVQFFFMLISHFTNISSIFHHNGYNHICIILISIAMAANCMLMLVQAKHSGCRDMQWCQSCVTVAIVHLLAPLSYSKFGSISNIPFIIGWFLVLSASYLYKLDEKLYEIVKKPVTGSDDAMPLQSRSLHNATTASKVRFAGIAAAVVLMLCVLWTGNSYLDSLIAGGTATIGIAGRGAAQQNVIADTCPIYELPYADPHSNLRATLTNYCDVWGSQYAFVAPGSGELLVDCTGGALFVFESQEIVASFPGNYSNKPYWRRIEQLLDTNVFTSNSLAKRGVDEVAISVARNMAKHYGMHQANIIDWQEVLLYPQQTHAWLWCDLHKDINLVIPPPNLVLRDGKLQLVSSAVLLPPLSNGDFPPLSDSEKDAVHRYIQNLGRVVEKGIGKPSSDIHSSSSSSLRLLSATSSSAEPSITEGRRLAASVPPSTTVTASMAANAATVATQLSDIEGNTRNKQFAPLFDSVIILYLDSISRQHFDHFYTKTKAIINGLRYAPTAADGGRSTSSSSSSSSRLNSNKIRRGSHSAFKLMKMHNFGQNSASNYPALLGGMNPSESRWKYVDNDGSRNIWLSDIAELMNYTTLNAYDECHLNCKVNCTMKASIHTGVEHGGYAAHYMYQTRERQPGVYNWPSVVRCEQNNGSPQIASKTANTCSSDKTHDKKWVGNRPVLDHVLEWFKVWLAAHRHTRRFAVLTMQDTHTTGFHHAFDRILERLFMELFLNSSETMTKLFNTANTAMVFISDHGMHSGTEFQPGSGKIANKIPMGYILLPNSYVDNHPKEADRLFTNANSRMTTPFDVRSTVEYWLTGGGQRDAREDATRNELSRRTSSISTISDIIAAAPIPSRAVDRVHSRSLVSDGISIVNVSNRVPSPSNARILNSHHHGINLQLTTVPLNRTCQDAGITESFCGCHKTGCKRRALNTVQEYFPAIADFINARLRSSAVNVLSVCIPIEASELFVVPGRVGCLEGSDGTINDNVLLLREEDALTVVLDVTLVTRARGERQPPHVAPHSALLTNSSTAVHSHSDSSEYVISDVVTLSKYGPTWEKCAAMLSRKGFSPDVVSSHNFGLCHCIPASRTKALKYQFVKYFG